MDNQEAKSDQRTQSGVTLEQPVVHPSFNESGAGEVHSSPDGQENKCSDVPKQVYGTQASPFEVVVLGDSSCTFSLDPLLEYLMEESEKPVKITSVVLGDGSLATVVEMSSAVSSWRMSALDSIQVALSTVFSNDALKVLVVVDCNLPGCQRQNSYWSGEEQQALLKSLLQQGLQLHVFTHDDFVVTQPDEVPARERRKILGLNSEVFYSTSHARKRRLRGNREQRLALAPPTNNLCVQLAVQSGGSVWSLRAFERIKKRSRRDQALALPALLLLRGLSAPHLQCRVCPCEAEAPCGQPCADPCLLCHPPPALPLNPVPTPELPDVEYEDEDDYD